MKLYPNRDIVSNAGSGTQFGCPPMPTSLPSHAHALYHRPRIRQLRSRNQGYQHSEGISLRKPIPPLTTRKSAITVHTTLFISFVASRTVAGTMRANVPRLKRTVYLLLAAPMWVEKNCIPPSCGANVGWTVFALRGMPRRPTAHH